MTKPERTGERDLTYSHAHRGHGTGHPDSSCTYQDIDGDEYCQRDGCAEPLLLVETTIGDGETYDEKTSKGYLPLYRLADKASVPAVFIVYSLGESSACDKCDMPFYALDKLWVRDVWPVRSGLVAWAPDAWWTEIERIHADPDHKHHL